MNLKNINFRNIKDNREKIASAVLRSRGLIFLIIFGFATVYSFDLLYKKVYIDPNFIQYSPNVDFLSVNRENATLEKIMGKINEREENLKNVAWKKYKDPFNFAASQIDGESAEITNGTVDSDNSSNGSSGNSGSTGNAEGMLAPKH